jgi:hypothetical protein
MIHDSGALTIKLAMTTVGIISNALEASGGIINTGTIPAAKTTALTIMKITAAI